MYTLIIYFHTLKKPAVHSSTCCRSGWWSWNEMNICNLHWWLIKMIKKADSHQKMRTPRESTRLLSITFMQPLPYEWQWTIWLIWALLGLFVLTKGAISLIVMDLVVIKWHLAALVSLNLLNVSNFIWVLETCFVIVFAGSSPRA